MARPMAKYFAKAKVLPSIVDHKTVLCTVELEIPKDIFGVLISLENEWFLREFTMNDKNLGLRKKILV